MAILPQDHRVLRVRVEREDGQIGEVLRGGLQQGASIFLSDRLITNLEDRSPMPAIGPEKTMFESFGLPGESEDGPNSPRKGVGAQDWEPTLAHELEHVALPQKYQRDLPSPAPTLYGRTNTDEHVAEVGGALYMGGTYAAEVPEDQWAAVKEMWDSYRGSVDGVKYEQPIGPHFVQCQELDIAQGPLPMRIRYGAQQVPAEITYHLTSDTPEHLTRTLGSTIITSPEV
jgi:hypothetical protein